MSKTYLPYEPDQQLLLPAALQEWLPETIWPTSSPTWWTSWTCRRSLLGTSGNGVAGPPYHPRMMVKTLLYGYCVGVGVLTPHRPASPRGHRLQGVGGEQHTGLPTISDFRKDNVDALSGLFVQVLALCQEAGLVKLGHVALDGTKVKANAIEA